MPRLTKKAAAARTSNMDTESLLLRIREARQNLDETLSNLLEASEALREHARKNRMVNDRSYQMFAMTNLRFSAATSQGLKRMAQTSDRLLVRAKTEQEETDRLEQQRQERAKLRKIEAAAQTDQVDQSRQVKEAARKTAKLIAHSDNAFEELYGEMLNGE